MALLEIKNLKKIYKTREIGKSGFVRAVDGVSLKIEARNLYGIGWGEWLRKKYPGKTDYRSGAGNVR